MNDIRAIKSKFKDDPEIISHSIKMNKPNKPIKIYQGDFILKSDSIVVKLNGTIQFEWFSNIGAKFYGITNITTRDYVQIQHINNFQLLIGNEKVGDAIITYFSLGNIIQLSGILDGSVYLGDISIPVEKIRFQITNLRNFKGSFVKKSLKKRLITGNCRLIFETKDHKITLDKNIDYNERSELLKSSGGYMLLYTGELISLKNKLTNANSKDVLNCFSIFITFINGSRTKIIFKEGIFNNSVIWKDFSECIISPYKNVTTWTTPYLGESLNDLWNKFYELWTGNYKEVLKSAIHWYVEANNSFDYPKGGIILSQTGLELVYNWLVIEEKKLLIGTDAEDLSAANKIRLLLNQLNLKNTIPSHFIGLKSMKNIVDGPDAFVQVRNAIVHSQHDKRKKLVELLQGTQLEALKLGIWYLEISLLFILGCKSRYRNRCSPKLNETDKLDLVPWIKI